MVVLVAIAMAVSACSGGNKPFSKETGTFAAIPLKKPPVITIAAIDGLSPANSQSLKRQITREARKRGIIAATNARGKNPVYVSGTLKVAPAGPNTAVANVSDVRDASKNRLLRVAGEDVSQKNRVNQNATALNAKTIQRIAAHATSGMAAWLGRQGYRVRDISLPPPGDVRNISVLRAEASSTSARQAITRNLYQATGAPRLRVAELSSPQSAQPEIAVPRRDDSPLVTASISGPRPLKPERQLTTVVVRPVSGASPQANVELTQAIKRALRTKGVRITESPVPSSLKLVGIVKMGPVRRRRQVISISWFLNRADGRRIGHIQQENKVLAASVAKSWGRTADLAARAAAQDIAKIVPRSTQTSSTDVR